LVPHVAPDDAGSCWQVLPAHVSTVHGFWSSQSPLAWQQPAIGLSPQVPFAQVASLHGAFGQSAGVQHCWHAPPQSVVPLGQTHAPCWQTLPPSHCGVQPSTHMPPWQDWPAPHA
jgi:hypothetical protein